MAQSNWYLRNKDQVFGPFPPLQIEEAMNAGEVTPEWEISLNGLDWMSIADSGQFKMDQAVWSSGDTQESLTWHEQRQQARKRWLQDGASVTNIARDPLQDAALRSSVARDHIRTQALLNQEKSKRSSPWIALLVLALIAVIGSTVWFGQRDHPIQASLDQSINCAAALTDGVNWSGCSKPGYAQAQARARNARMDRVQLEDARLGGADLAYASFKHANLRNAELSRVNLTGADLSQADLSGADLSGADMRYAVLSNATLTGTRFNATQLDKATWNDGRVCGVGSLDVCR